jgi:hypothetical protein
MEVNAHLQASAVLHSGKRPRYSVRAGLAPQSFADSVLTEPHSAEMISVEELIIKGQFVTVLCVCVCVS